MGSQMLGPQFMKQFLIPAQEPTNGPKGNAGRDSTDGGFPRICGLVEPVDTDFLCSEEISGMQTVRTLAQLPKKLFPTLVGLRVFFSFPILDINLKTEVFPKFSALELGGVFAEPVYTRRDLQRYHRESDDGQEDCHDDGNWIHVEVGSDVMSWKCLGVIV